MCRVRVPLFFVCLKVISSLCDRARLVLAAGLDEVSCRLKGKSLVWRWTKGAGAINQIAEASEAWFGRQYR